PLTTTREPQWPSPDSNPARMGPFNVARALRDLLEHAKRLGLDSAHPALQVAEAALERASGLDEGGHGAPESLPTKRDLAAQIGEVVHVTLFGEHRTPPTAAHVPARQFSFSLLGEVDFSAGTAHEFQPQCSLVDCLEEAEHRVIHHVRNDD